MISSVYLTLEEVKKLSDGVQCSFYAAMVEKVSRIASNGNAYLSVSFLDATGVVNCSVFEDQITYPQLNSANIGDVFEVKAQIRYSKNKLTPELYSATNVPHSEVSANAELFNRLRPSVSENLSEGFVEVVTLLAPLKGTPFDRMLNSILHAKARAMLEYPYQPSGPRGELLLRIRELLQLLSHNPLAHQVNKPLLLAAGLVAYLGKFLTIRESIMAESNPQARFATLFHASLDFAEHHIAAAALPPTEAKALRHCLLGVEAGNHRCLTPEAALLAHTIQYHKGLMELEGWIHQNPTEQSAYNPTLQTYLYPAT